MYIGKGEKIKLFPAEVVSIISGQSVKAKLTMDETSEMLKFACRSPYANAFSLTSDETRATLSHDAQLLKNFGISVDKSLLAINARVLNVPYVSYRNSDRKQVEIRPQFGSWNLKALHVANPGEKIERWTWINLVAYGGSKGVGPDIPEKFAKFLSDGMGIHISKQPIYPRETRMTREEAMHPNGKLAKFFDWMKSEQIQLCVVILAQKESSALYSNIKMLGDCQYGIHTSCVVANQFGKGDLSYFANVGLKINLKFGGINHVLKESVGLLKGGRTMIAGYDVTHPTNMGPRTGKGALPPSVVGLVASIDSGFGQWPAVSWEQESKQELLGDVLVSMFASRLDLWKKYNDGALPENIIFFRDGVSEGQFAQVISEELPFLREACRKKYSGGRQPKITIIVSVKRHQTRFYPTKEDEMSRSGNIQNGTVVDRGITQARYWDFFLTAHDALQGTARPAHYTVILDEIFGPTYGAQAANELERLTHDLCYLYGRATKAVSICPPAYYADIVCTRARAHRPEFFDAGDTETVSSIDTASVSGRNIHPALRDSMYYI